MQVAIVGGGVCGLTCAVALIKAGVDVQVYEAAAQFGEIGAGIGIGPNVSRVLQRLGLVEDIMSKGEKTHREWFQYLFGMEEHEVLHEMSLPPGEEPFMVHRAVFLNALVKHVDHNRVHFHKRCTSVTSAQPESTDSRSATQLVMHFADGSTARADVVIGADGIKSSVRGTVTGRDHNESITYSHTSCYRGLVPIERVRAAGVVTDFTKRPLCYIGPGKHVVAAGVNGGKLVNVVAFGSNENMSPETWERGVPANPTVSSTPKNELLSEYGDWGNGVRALLGCIDTWSRWKINVVYPALDSYANGRVVLVGDAAHGMQPHLGAGAGQGIEDAYLLAQLLSHPQTSMDNIEAVLSVYDAVRRPRAQRVWDDTYRMGQIVDGLGESGLSAEGLKKDLTGIWDYLWGHGADDDMGEAEVKLRELGIL